MSLAARLRSSVLHFFFASLSRGPRTKEEEKKVSRHDAIRQLEAIMKFILITGTMCCRCCRVRLRVRSYPDGGVSSSANPALHPAKLQIINCTATALNHRAHHNCSDLRALQSESLAIGETSTRVSSASFQFDLIAISESLDSPSPRQRINKQKFLTRWMMERTTVVASEES
jgi:hypothetical protein